MTSSKVLCGDKAGKFEQWRPPSMGDGQPGSKGRVARADKQAPLLTAEQLEQLQQEAYQEGFEQGKREGFEYGHKEALAESRGHFKEQIECFERLLATLNAPLQQLDEQVERELVEMVISMVRQLVRREVKADPGQIIGIVREALAILPVSSRNIRVILHPEDASTVREIYALSENELGWKIVEDPVVAQGGCRVVTESSQVDATLESRLATLIATLLGGERDEDQDLAEEDARDG